MRTFCASFVVAASLPAASSWASSSSRLLRRGVRQGGIHRQDTCTFTAVDANGDDDGGSNAGWVGKATAANFVSGALLGPNLDNYHSAFGVLKYNHPFYLYAPDGSLLLTTSAFVPPLFGLAGIIVGGLYLALDAVIDETQGSNLSAMEPSGPLILTGISYFTFQYWLSGLLAGGLHASLLLVHGVLAATMAGSWVLFDGTLTGLLVGLATALGGPAIEFGLINQLHLYTYADADMWGTASWIPWVYGAGAPAVGNLARGYRALLRGSCD